MTIAMLYNYFKIAWKNILKSRGLSVINIFGLAIGISASLAIWFILQHELSYDTFHPDRDRTYRLVSDFGGTGDHRYSPAVPMPTAAEAKLKLTGMETITCFHNYNATVTIPVPASEPKHFPKVSDAENNNDLIFAAPEYFKIFNYKWLVGNPASALTEPYRVVLSTREALKYFGSSDWENLIGRQIIYDDTIKTTVAGIVKELEGNTDFTFTDFISYSTIDAGYLRGVMQSFNWMNWNSNVQTFVKLEKGKTTGQLEKELTSLVGHHFDWDPGAYRVYLQPLSDLHYSQKYGIDYGKQANLSTLYGLLGIAAIILIIAAINFVNLSLAQSLQRVKEIGIRKILGSSRAGLVFQFLTETFLMSLLALIVSLIIMKPLLAAFPSFIPRGVLPDILNPKTILFIISLLIITTVLSGLYPGLVLSAFQPADALKSKTGIKGGFSDQFRKGLIVFQFTVSLIFIIASIFIGNQIHYMLRKDLGFKQDAIVTLDTNGWDSVGKKKLFAERVSNLTGVEQVSLDDMPPAVHGIGTVPCIYAGPTEINIGVTLRHVDEHYIPLYQIKMIAGRNFFAGDTSNAVIINETCAKMLGFQNPEKAVGKFLSSGAPNLRGGPDLGRHDYPVPVIGVVADFNLQPLNRKILPLVIYSIPANEDSYSIKLKTQGKDFGHFTDAIDDIEKVWKEIFPSQPFVFHFYDDTIADFYSKEQKTSQFVYLAMGIGVFISCIGLFALAALTAENRRKEIGIRKVLGANVRMIVTMLSKDFIKPVFIAIVIASPIAGYLMNKWLQDYAYRIHDSWWIFVLAGAVALCIAMITVSSRAIRVAMANPVASLRSE
jgi:putative ABC transport system permease protein